jgi:hypothetical protein
MIHFVSIQSNACAENGRSNLLKNRPELKCLFGFGRERDWCCVMKDDQHRFLSLLGQLPVRLTAEQAGWVLNCQVHDIPALVNARLLKPLGNPAQNSAKYFSTADVLETAKDRAWLVKMSNAISQHWQHHNARKKGCSANGAENGHASLLAA